MQASVITGDLWLHTLNSVTFNIVKLFYKVKTITFPEYFQEMFPATNPTAYELRATPLLQEKVVRSGTGKMHHVSSTKHKEQNWSLFAGIVREAL